MTPGIRGCIVLATIAASAAAGWVAGGHAGAHSAGELWNAANVTSDNRTAMEIKRDVERSARK